MEIKVKIQRLAFLRTHDSWGPFILRTLMAIVIFPHGAQKLFGMYGGYGFTGTMEYFSSTVGMPYSLGLVVILLETFGVLLLLFGLATRVLALCFTVLGIGIMFTSHLDNGFFMNWYGNQAGEGIEYFLLWIAITCSLTFMGAGKYSLDHWLHDRWLRKRENYWIPPGKV
ncbi:MAG TPA: DoxX family protein [Eudoraea sp.]|nr:DoxX family protein [Eudoraea sp.]